MASAARTAVPPSAMRSGSSPPWVASTTSPRRSLPTIRIWSPAPSRACTPSPILRLQPDRPRPCTDPQAAGCAGAPPNAAAVLVLHLGCENLQHDQFVEELGEYDHDRVKFLTCQEVDDEFTAAAISSRSWLPMPGSSSVSLSPCPIWWWA